MRRCVLFIANIYSPFESFQNVSRRIVKDDCVGDSGLGDSGELSKENNCRGGISHI